MRIPQECFQKKTRQIKKLESRLDFIEAEKAPGPASSRAAPELDDLDVAVRRAGRAFDAADSECANPIPVCSPLNR